MTTARKLIEAMTIDADKDTFTKWENARNLTIAELQQVIKFQETGFRIMIAVRLDVATDETGDSIYRDAAVGAVQITRKDALHFVDNCLSKSLQDKDARIRCYVTCRRSWKISANIVRTLWISQ